jgi:NAD(P)-dependent dehydrogenase (short-subunit alcohol dehydrogenase family)
MLKFQNKRVLITGGNSGIGLATARAFAAEGANVVITGRDTARLEAAVASLGPRAVGLLYDAGEVKSAHRLAEAIASKGMHLDAVFLNAGVAEFAPFEAADEAMWERSFAVNVKAPYFSLQALLPMFNRGAAVVLNGSINAHIGMAGSSVYAASKAAMISLAKTLSTELMGRGIRVNVVSCGPIATPLHGWDADGSEREPASAAAIRQLIPVGRFGTPMEVASAVLYLASPDAAFIVGTELIVDGGMSQL